VVCRPLADKRDDFQVRRRGIAFQLLAKRDCAIQVPIKQYRIGALSHCQGMRLLGTDCQDDREASILKYMSSEQAEFRIARTDNDKWFHGGFS
jgi:hypothetical protein